jgi:hydrogenase maturation protease
MSKLSTLIVGIGSPHGDDQAGWRVVDALRAILSSAIEVREASTPSQLLDWLDCVGRLIICDACQVHRRVRDDSAGATQSVHRWQWPTLQVSMLRSAGSHSFGLPQVLQLAERLGRLPQDVIVFGIEGRQFDAFASLSPNVEELIDKVVEKIADESGGAPDPAGQLNPAHSDLDRWEPAPRSSIPIDKPCGEETGHA